MRSIILNRDSTNLDREWNMKQKRINLDQYLLKYNEEMGSLARDLRNMILEQVPDMDEVIKWKNLFYEKKGYVCAIVIHKDHVNLQFAHGTELDDPEGILEGTGKKIRHVKINNIKEINSDKLKNLVVEAVNLNITN
ncbi:MAG: DUF1801 domain-containing protein [Methanobacterium sp.]